MAQTPSKSCEFCNKLATLYCYECQQFLCSQCQNEIHDRVAVCRDHNVVDIHKAGNRIYKPVPVCDSHKKEFLYYCSKCDCLTCKECMTSFHNGHITKEIKKITDIHRQDVDQIINKLKTKVEELKKTLETIDSDHSLLIQSGCDSYIEDVEKMTEEIHQIINHYKHIESNTAFDFRDTETHKLKGTRVFFQRLHDESFDILLKFENLLQEPHDNSFFMEWKGLQTEYQIMTEERVHPLSSPIQMSDFNKDTFRRVIIDEIDKQFQMGLKEQETAVATLTEEVDKLNEKLKGKQEESDNLSKLSIELQLKKKQEIELLDENNKLKTEIQERNLMEFALQKEQETTVARLTNEMDILKEELKVRQEQIDNLSKLSRELQLKEKKEIELLDENNKLRKEIKQRNLREFALQKGQETAFTRLRDEMGVLKEILKVKEEQIDNLLNKVENKSGIASNLTLNSVDEIKEKKLKHTVTENTSRPNKGNLTQQNAFTVVAIELGTTHSGWAFSPDRIFKECFANIQTKRGWLGRDGYPTETTSTVALFTPEDKFHSFGYEAEEKYAKLMDDGDATRGWKYFKGFTKAVFIDETIQFGHQQSNLATRKSSYEHLEDVNGRKLSTMMVFLECLKFLKDDVLTYMQQLVDNFETGDIHWIITVPAFWSEHGKKFMRHAASQAGIGDEMLSLIYEPDAMAIYCKTWKDKTCPMVERDENDTIKRVFNTSEKFLVLDCGEEMVIITAYQSQEDNKHIELFRPTVVPCGGKEVDNQFLKLVINIFGVDIWRKFEKTNMDDCLETMRHLKNQRKVIGSKNVDKVRIGFPHKLLYENRSETALEFCSVKGVTNIRDKIIFPIQVLQALFEKPTNAIAGHVKQLLKKSEMAGLRTIFMTGSFSDSPLLYKNMQTRFPSFKVLRPEGSLLSVSKGAVMFGFHEITP